MYGMGCPQFTSSMVYHCIVGWRCLVLKSISNPSSSGTNLGIGKDAVSEMVLRLATACISVCEGQAIDTGMAGSEIIPSIELYLDMIRKKTAALFEVSCALGVLCTGASEKDVKTFPSLALIQA
jgi:geranylgeranyl diphosphate synthase type I